MNVLPTFLLLLLFSVLKSGLFAEPLVKISQGFLKGTLFETRKGRNVSAFIGIPYGQSTSGYLRFKSPLPAKPWKGIRLANKEANACSQNYFGRYIGDEDCLYLNVFTPILEFKSFKLNGPSKKNLLPVMVYVHGGGFSQESSNLTAYSPKYLMDRNILFVSMNYRLGILGFLSTGDTVAPGNFGLKDQTLALKWVQKNIQFFGGDPKRVTVFGNSAGAGCVNLLALSDATNDLFQQYIIQSGSLVGIWGFQKQNKFKPFVKEIAMKVGCPSINSKILIKCLRSKNVRKIMEADSSDAYSFMPWLPTSETESKNAFLTDSPLNLLAQNKMKDLPFMTGNTVDEGIIITLAYLANWTSNPIVEYLEEYINGTYNFYLKQNLTKYRNLVKDFYFSEPIISMNQDELLKNFTKYGGDTSFLYPQIIILDKMVKTVKSPIYLYSFGYRGNTTLLSMELNVTKNIGVCHAEDLVYLFPKGYAGGFPKKDEKILNLMVDLWTSFAANGKPTSDELDDPNLWLPYNEKGNFLQIGNINNNTDASVTLEQDYFSDRMNFWRHNFPLL